MGTHARGDIHINVAAAFAAPTRPAGKNGGKGIRTASRDLIKAELINRPTVLNLLNLRRAGRFG